MNKSLLLGWCQEFTIEKVQKRQLERDDEV